MGNKNQEPLKAGGCKQSPQTSSEAVLLPPTVRRPAFFVDTQTCTGCKTCMVACKDKNDLPDGVRWRRVYEYSGGEWVVQHDGTFRQDIFAYYLSVSCNHCEQPICVEACPTRAMNAGDDGIVSVDQTKCIGCRYCEWACPYGAPQYHMKSGVMTKCDFCRDNLESGIAPACVAACPTRALTFGEFKKPDFDEASDKCEEIAPLPDCRLTTPHALFTPHRKGKPSGSLTGRIANPEEIKDVRS